MCSRCSGFSGKASAPAASTGHRNGAPGDARLPSFLFRAERDPPAEAPNPVHKLTDFEVATRLSFFLWSNIPDDELLDVASRGELKEPAVLHSRSAGCCPTIPPRRSSRTSPDSGSPAQLPRRSRHSSFQISTRASARRSAGDRALLRPVMREDGQLLELLNADYTFVNERLARHYGIPKVYGGIPARGARPTPARRAPRQGSVAGATSHPTARRRCCAASGFSRISSGRRHPAAAGRSGLKEKNQEGARSRCASGWCSIAPTRRARAATR